MTVRIPWPKEIERKLQPAVALCAVLIKDNSELTALGHLVGSVACPACDKYTGTDARFNGNSAPCNCGGRIHRTHIAETDVGLSHFTAVNIFCDKCGEDVGRSFLGTQP